MRCDPSVTNPQPNRWPSTSKQTASDGWDDHQSRNDVVASPSTTVTVGPTPQSQQSFHLADGEAEARAKVDDRVAAGMSDAAVTPHLFKVSTSDFVSRQTLALSSHERSPSRVEVIPGTSTAGAGRREGSSTRLPASDFGDRRAVALPPLPRCVHFR